MLLIIKYTILLKKKMDKEVSNQEVQFSVCHQEMVAINKIFKLSLPLLIGSSWLPEIKEIYN